MRPRRRSDGRNRCPRHPTGAGGGRHRRGPAERNETVTPDRRVQAGKATIAIIGGTGALGAGLAWRLARAGHAIVIGSRTAEKAEAAAKYLAASVTGGTPPRGAGNADAAKAAEVVFVTVP